MANIHEKKTKEVVINDILRERNALWRNILVIMVNDGEVEGQDRNDLLEKIYNVLTSLMNSSRTCDDYINKEQLLANLKISKGEFANIVASINKSYCFCIESSIDSLYIAISNFLEHTSHYGVRFQYHRESNHRELFKYKGSSSTLESILQMWSKYS